MSNQGASKNTKEEILSGQEKAKKEKPEKEHEEDISPDFSIKPRSPCPLFELYTSTRGSKGVENPVDDQFIDPEVRELNGKIISVILKRLEKVKREKKKKGTLDRTFALREILDQIKTNPQKDHGLINLEHIKQSIRDQLIEDKEALDQFNRGVKEVSTSNSKFRLSKESRFKQMENTINKMIEKFTAKKVSKKSTGLT